MRRAVRHTKISLCDIAACEIHTLGNVRQRKAFEHGDDVRDAVARVHDNTGEQALGIERQNCLHSNVNSAEVVSLKHGFDHVGAVGHGVHGRLGEHDAAVFLAGVDAEAREGVVPDVKHILPAAHNTLVHRVSDLQHVAVLLALVSNHDVLDLGFARIALF